MIALIAQLVVSAALSIGAFVLVGAKLYLLIEVVLTFVVFGCLMAVPGKYDSDADEPYPLRDIAITAGIAIFIGALWAALPLIVAWGVAARRPVDACQPSTLQDPSAERRTDEAA